MLQGVQQRRRVVVAGRRVRIRICRHHLDLWELAPGAETVKDQPLPHARMLFTVRILREWDQLCPVGHIKGSSRRGRTVLVLHLNIQTLVALPRLQVLGRSVVLRPS